MNKKEIKEIKKYFNIDWKHLDGEFGLLDLVSVKEKLLNKYKLNDGFGIHINVKKDTMNRLLNEFYNYAENREIKMLDYIVDKLDKVEYENN